MKWDGRTMGTPNGYRFFFFCIRNFGLEVAYFCCFFVAAFYLLFLGKQRRALMSFHQKSFGVGKVRSFFRAWQTFLNYSISLVDKFGIAIKWRHKFHFKIIDDRYIKNLLNDGNGGMLVSGHIGNGEIAGNLINEMITSKINVLFYKTESQNIQDTLQAETGMWAFKIIEIKNDLSHLIKIKSAVNNNELIALHADRMLKGEKCIEINMFGNTARFPIGPFIMAKKFNVPVLYVFSFKIGYRKYSVEAHKPSSHDLSPEEMCMEYAEHFINKVKQHPLQFYNFFNFYVS